MEAKRSRKNRRCSGCKTLIRKGQIAYSVSKLKKRFCSMSCKTTYVNDKEGFSLDPLFWDDMDFYETGKKKVVPISEIV